MKKLLIVGGGEMQVPIIKKAKELGHFCIVSDYDPNAPGFTDADVCLNISTLDSEKTLSEARKYNIDGILTTSDYPVRTVAFVCNAMDLCGISQYSSELCTNKYYQRKALSQSDILLPNFVLVSEKKKIKKIVENFHFPLIVKPIDSSASRGVSKVINIEELYAAYEYSTQFGFERKVIVEDFIEGPEYSVESLTQSGETHIIAITEKSTTGSLDKFFVESRHIVPANLTTNDEHAIVNYVNQVVKHLRIDNSACHTEIKLSSKGPILIEIASRLGGDYITSDLVPLATGVDMLENVIRIALNEKIKITPTKQMFAGISFVNSDNYFKANDFISKNQPLIFRSEMKPFKNSLMTNSFDRLGYVIINTNNRIKLKELLDFNNI